MADLDPFSPQTPQREVVLVKRNQRYVFRYAPGEEHDLLESLIRMVQDPESDLDWFDAAVLCHQIGAKLSERLESMTRTTRSSP